MAEEKKKPDLKSRLNKGTMVGNPPLATASSEPAFAPPPGFGDDLNPAQRGLTPPLGMDIPPPPASAMSNDDIAVPEFIKQQMAEKAAAEARAAAERAAAEARAIEQARREAEQARLAALAADPFSSGSSSSAQEIRLVIDDKAVSDSEVGRKNTGTIVTALATGAVALIAGYLVGDFKASKDEESKTRAAITDIRQRVDATGATITQLKDKVDRAAERAGIQSGEEAQAPAQPAAPAQAQLDEELITWFGAQSPDPPLAPDAYAGRVGRLRPDLVSKLMKVQIEIAEVWHDLARHQNMTQGPNLAVIRNSLRDAQAARTEYQRLAVVFSPGRGENAPPVVATLVNPTVDPDGAGFTFTPPLPGAPHRTIYTTGDLALPTTIGTVGIPVAPTAGLANTTVNALGRPWGEYVARLRTLKTHVDALQTDHHTLADTLSRAGVN